MITDTASLWAGVRRFEDILKRDPQAYSFAPLVDLYLSLGLIEDALQAARKGCAVHPGFAAGQMAWARAALESSLKDEAKSALEQVVRITPERLEAQRLLADIYSADGEQAAAQRCLGIVNSLEPTEPVFYKPSAAAESIVAELADEDILELTDDLIEADAEVDQSSPESPFSADPLRPSLGVAPHRAEPFLLEQAPPLYDPAQTETSPEPVALEDAEPLAAVASATIAELYVTQGFPEKGVEVYREMLQREPENEVWRQRLAELTAPVVLAELSAMPAKAMTVAAAISASTEVVLETLCGWLANIGRIRECRTKSV